MKVFSISDLHLSGLAGKPMDVFGAGWENHFEKIKADWKAKVESEDIVLICGDISWGTDIEEGLYDLRSATTIIGGTELQNSGAALLTKVFTFFRMIALNLKTL